MTEQQVMIVVGTPPEAVDAILSAISSAGGGIIGDYTHCAYTSAGQGRFKPSANANPHIGAKEQINTVEEVRIETFCARRVAKGVCNAIREAHPYEEVVIYVVPLLSEDEL